MTLEEWKREYAKDLRLLGLKVEDRPSGWTEGPSVKRPLLLETVVCFPASAKDCSNG